MNAESPGSERRCAEVAPGERSRGRSRREAVREGVRIAFVAPVVSSFFARTAYAAKYSCYPAGHACPGAEPCCSGSCNLGVCTGG